MKQPLQNQTVNSRFSFYAPVLLLLLYWVSRMYHLLILPVFLDEASHITRAQWVWQDQRLCLLSTGEALAPYLVAGFWPFHGWPFIGRCGELSLGAGGISAGNGARMQRRAGAPGTIAR